MRAPLLSLILTALVAPSVFASDKCWRYLSLPVGSKDIPRIDLNKVSQRHEEQPDYKGGHHLKLEKGLLNGKLIFIKTSIAFVNPPILSGNRPKHVRGLGPPSMRDVLRETSWLTFLDREGWGPKFYGVSKENNHPVIVEEYIEGITLELGAKPDQIARKLRKLERAFRVSIVEINDNLRELQEFLRMNNIYPVDLQFRITSGNRVVVVDPEMFEVYGPRPTIKENWWGSSNENFANFYSNLAIAQSMLSSGVH